MDVETVLLQEASWAARAMIANDKTCENDVRMLYSSYRPRIGLELQCPKCWVRERRKSALRSVPGTDEYDLLRCNSNTCGVDIVVPI